MNAQNIAEIVLRVNGKEARTEIENYRRQLKLAEQAKKDLEKNHANGETWTEKEVKQMTKYTKEINKCRKQLADTQATSEKLRMTIQNLDKANPVQLSRTLKTLENSLKKVQRGSLEWKQLTVAISKTRAELNKIKAETAAFKEEELAPPKSLLQRLQAFGDKWSGISMVVQTGTNLVKGATSAMKSYVDEYADLAEHMASVSKYTGLAKEDVEDLNESFKKMDTRTALTALNDLAADAGRLGIQSKQEILDFVEAADQINVALGEDLGEGAVKNIGKLAELFGDSEKLGLKQAMLATGSTINELAQSSSAAEGYIMDFTQRLSGMANTAGMTQAQVMGLASVLDQANVQAEVGATALSNVIQKMYRTPAAFAQAAKIDLQDFTKTLQTDANQALIMFAEGIGNLGSMEEVSTALASLHITGAGVSQTLTALANNIDLVKTTQQQATEAFREATSVTNEANVANSTVQAQLEKTEQKYAQLRAEMGERLLPVYVKVLDAGLKFKDLLGATVALITNHIWLFGSLAAAVVTYYTVVAVAIARQKLFNAIQATTTALHTAGRAALILLSAGWNLLTGNVTRATAALRLFNTVTKLNPWGAILAAITAVVTALALFKKRTDEAAEAQKSLNNIKEDAAAKMDEERRKIELLNNIAADETRSLKDRRTAVAELNKIIPNYNAQIDETTGKYRSSKKALDDYLVSLQKKYELEGAKELLKELGAEKAKLTVRKAQQQQEIKEINDRQKKVESSSAAYVTGGVAGVSVAQLSGIGNSKAVTNLNKDLNETNRQLSLIEKKTDAINKAYGSDLKNNALKQVTNSGNGNSGGGGNSGVSGGYGSTTTTTDKEYPATTIQRRAEAAKIAAEIAYESGLVSLQEYRDKAYQIEVQAIQEEQALYKQGSPEWNKLELQRLKLKKQYIEESTEEQRKADEEDKKQQQQRQKDFAQKVAEIRREYLQKPIEEQQADELAMLDSVHQQGLLSEEEYQKARAAIIEKYKQQATKGTETVSTSGMDSTTASVVNLMAAINTLHEKLKTDGKASWEDYAQIAVAALASVSAMLSSASSLVSANAAKEEAEITARYDAEIEAAGSSTKKGKKLEEQKQAEIAKVKTKYNKREMALEIAQAIASGAMAAINAYASASKISWVLGPIAAAMAVAATGIQIASIKKQHEAEAAGYYEGGFTADIDPKKVAGVVHGGEFVATAAAVNNPALSPVFSLLDHAQKTNTVSSLTPSKVSQQLTAAQQTASASSSLTAQNSLTTAAIATQAAVARDTATQLERLATQLENGITAYAEISGSHGVARQLDKYNKMINR